MLHRLVDDVDGVDHVAFLLSVVQEEGAQPVGVARVIRYPDNPPGADVAVTVMDEWQGRGVAAELVKVLRSHLPEGVVQIETEIAADNAASLAMLRHLGHPEVTATADCRLHVVVQLDDADSCSGTAKPGSIEST
jgi:RimJ/RimL family protein N-acetyltransferase